MKMVNILIIGHDSKRTTALTSLMNNHPNRETVTATDVEEAIEWLHRRPFDIVITDETADAIQTKKLEKLVSWQFPDTILLNHTGTDAELNQRIDQALQEQQKALKANYAINDDAFKGFIAWE